MYPTLDDKPVTDLQQDDIELLEDGRPQKVVQFEHVLVAGQRQQTRREPSTLEEMRRAAQDPRARVFVLFLDPRHVDVKGSMQVRRPLIDALNALIGGDDLIAIMTPEMSARGLTFTRRTSSIEAMLTPHWGQEGWPGTKDPVEARYDHCYAPPIIDGEWMAREMVARRREVLVLDAVEDLVQFLRGLREERKAVITISDGWPLYGPEPNLRKPLLTPTQDPAEPANVFIPIPKAGADPRTGRPTVKDPSSVTISNDGIGTVDRAACEVDRYALAELRNEKRLTDLMQEANRANVSFYPIGPGGFSAAYAPLGGRRRSLELMADITDGQAIVQPAYMETGIRRIVDDLSNYYLVGYYSTAEPDGKFHKITVRVKRPGVAVRARSGYLAAKAAEAVKPVTSTTSVDTSEARMVAQALSSLAAFSRELPLRVQASAAWTRERTAIVRAVAEVPRSTATGDDWSKGGQVDATLLNAAGEMIAKGGAALSPGTFVVQIPIAPPAPLEPGDYKVLVRTKGAAALGSTESVTFTLEADPLGAGTLFFRRFGRSEMPTADLRFRRTERIIVETPASIGSDVSARLLGRNGVALTVPATATIRDDADGTRWRRVEITLAPLAPGEYIVETTAGAERTLTAFRVVP
jgi:VWFA-related protein